MNLPDCPPGAEGYEDSVVEKTKIPDDDTSTKAEQEFQEHLNSLKIKLENGETRCMVERRGRDISGKWIYLCYPCAAVCSGENILQMHISGKKHKTKLSLKTAWPASIFDDHPFIQNQKGGSMATSKVLAKMAEEVDLHTKPASDFEQRFRKYRESRCHIQDILDNIRAPLLGVEYLVEHPPEQPHYEPKYMCTLCMKQGQPRTIINHLTCFWHRNNYLIRHFPAASSRLNQYNKSQRRYRDVISIIVTRLAQRIQDIYGRMRPVHIDDEEFEKDKDQILQWLFKAPHFSEKPGMTLEEVVDTDLIETMSKSTFDWNKMNEPSPPVIAAPSRPINHRQYRERNLSIGSLSDISDDGDFKSEPYKDKPSKMKNTNTQKNRYEPYSARKGSAVRSRRENTSDKNEDQRPPNYDHKMKLATEKRVAAEAAAKMLLKYHEKNPEKHPLYPEEWRKFWNTRYKQLQAEGKDPSKHDFKPEWIVYWTKRMTDVHEEELKTQILEIYRRLNLPEEMIKLDPSSQPIFPRKSKSPEKQRSPERRKSPDRRRRSPERYERRRSPVSRRRSPEPRRRSPESRRRSPEPRRRQPEPRRRSPEPRRRSPEPRRRSPAPRRRSPEPRKKSPEPRRRSPETRRKSPERKRSPDPIRQSPDKKPEIKSFSDQRHGSIQSMSRDSPAVVRTRSRSPLSSRSGSRAATTERLSPLSLRESELRNRSPLPRRDLQPPPVTRNDDQLKPDGSLSPWNSDNDMESVCSAARSLGGSGASAARRKEGELGAPENVVATLRLLVALEDYLGSLGPKIVDLLTDALKMEKAQKNLSEKLLDQESVVVLIETAKEKLKGASQAGLVPATAAPAVKAAVVKVAATLHEADKRALMNKSKKPEPIISKPQAVPVTSVGGEVNRAQIAQQMAAALIAQGKTDVTSEELAELVEAVVGMAEAKKRVAEPKTIAPIVVHKPATAVKLTGTATALQLLQSAYDDNDKKEKEEAADVMDGLSDSDLETLLKNFNELSAEEQHSLIAYLKKVEAREPQRVESLRQYVSAAANAAPLEPENPVIVHKEPVTTSVIESDDDDYNVDEVFQTATQKVQEDPIRKELDIVKETFVKEAERSNSSTSAVETSNVIDISSSSSATSLFALVQASIKPTAAPTPAVFTNTSAAIPSNSAPRSFGDDPDMNIESMGNSNGPSSNQDFNRNYQNEFNQNDKFHQNEQVDSNELNNQNDQYENIQNDEYDNNQNDEYDNNQNDEYDNNQNHEYQDNQNDDYNNDNQHQWNSNNLNSAPIPDNREQPYYNYGHDDVGQSDQGPPDQFNQEPWGQNNDWQRNSGPSQNWQENTGPNQNWRGNNSQNQMWQGNNLPQNQNWQENPAETWQDNQVPNQRMGGNIINRNNQNRPPFNTMNSNQPFGNFNNTNFRGRGGRSGRGNFPGGPRPRGRGRF